MAVSGMLSDRELERYSRALMMPDFDIAGQEKLLRARVLIVGLGGLGSPASMYLACAGVGTLVLADGDCVELSNLQRQIAHGESDIGSNKAHSAAASIAERNSTTAVVVVEKHLGQNDMPAVLKGVDVVVDASDNYPTRYALNRACIERAIPLVSAAAVLAEGQLSVFDPASGGPCYRCLYPQEGSESALNCSQSGVLAPVVGVFGSLLAMEVLKVLSGYGDCLRGALLLMDLKTMDVRKLSLPRRENCPDCGHLP